MYHKLYYVPNLGNVLPNSNFQKKPEIINPTSHGKSQDFWTWTGGAKEPPRPSQICLNMIVWSVAPTHPPSTKILRQHLVQHIFY